MGCGCINQISFDSILNLFWKGLLIRKVTFNDIIDIIRAKKKGTDNIQDKKFQIFIEALLINPDYKELSYQLFNHILNEARKRENEGFFFLSLLFLGKGNDMELSKAFLSIALTHSGLKDYIIINMNNSNNLIKKKELYKFIEFYIEMISSMCIDDLSNISDNKLQFKKVLKKQFCKNNRDKFIENKIFENYISEQDIDIETFICEKYPILSNDIYIRDWMLQYVINENLTEN